MYVSCLAVFIVFNGPFFVCSTSQKNTAHVKVYIHLAEGRATGYHPCQGLAPIFSIEVGHKSEICW